MIPSHVLTDLGVLNAHARVYSAGSVRWAIYAYKEAATFLLLDAGALAVTPIAWTGPCGSCSGTGRFTHWDGEQAACRDCTRGQVRLRFAEVALPDGQVWHHPYVTREGAPGLDMLRRTFGDVDKIEWREPGDWKPLTPGTKMACDDLVAVLNRVEGFVLGLADRHDGPRETGWRLERALRQMTRYALDVRERVPARCFRCGRPDNLRNCRLGSSGGWPLSWSAPVCLDCDQAVENGRKVWPTVFPAEAMSPEITLWVSRRPKERPGI